MGVGRREKKIRRKFASLNARPKFAATDIPESYMHEFKKKFRCHNDATTTLTTPIKLSLDALLSGGHEPRGGASMRASLEDASRVGWEAWVRCCDDGHACTDGRHAPQTYPDSTVVTVQLIPVILWQPPESSLWPAFQMQQSRAPPMDHRLGASTSLMESLGGSNAGAHRAAVFPGREADLDAGEHGCAGTASTVGAGDTPLTDDQAAQNKGALSELPLIGDTQLAPRALEEDWSLRTAKRSQMVAKVKQSCLYRVCDDPIVRSKSVLERPLTPDPNDRHVSKRLWERQRRLWIEAIWALADDASSHMLSFIQVADASSRWRIIASALVWRDGARQRGANSGR